MKPNEKMVNELINTKGIPITFGGNLSSLSIQRGWTQKELKLYQELKGSTDINAEMFITKNKKESGKVIDFRDNKYGYILKKRAQPIECFVTSPPEINDFMVHPESNRLLHITKVITMEGKPNRHTLETVDTHIQMKKGSTPKYHSIKEFLGWDNS